jgi:hypothetical protein
MGETKSGYAGIVLIGNTSRRFEGEDADQLWQQLHREVERSHPRFVGFDGARNRFLRIFPEGFSAPLYRKEERDYKLKAKAKLDVTVPLERALTETGLAEAIMPALGTNLLHSIENAKFREALKGPLGDQFIRGAAIFAEGDLARGLAQMEQALRPHEVANWTAVTYFPFLWRPAIHMFLKPEVTRKYAECVGHAFSHTYSSHLKPATYECLLNLVSMTVREISDLRPADHIDIQSFIWVVGEYTADDEAKVRAAGLGE